MTSSDDAAAVITDPLAATADNGVPARQEITEPSSSAPPTGRQNGSDGPADVPAGGSRDADTANQPGCSDDIAPAETLHDAALDASGAAVRDADGRDDDHCAAAKQTATPPSRAILNGVNDARLNNADGVSDASDTAAVAIENNRRPGRQDDHASNAGERIPSALRACNILDSAASSSQAPAAALPKARLAQEAAAHREAARRDSDEQLTGVTPQNDASALSPISAVMLGNGKNEIAGLRPASSEDSESQMNHEPRRAAAAGQRGKHMRSLSRVSVGSTVSSGVSEHPFHGATTADPDPAQEAVDAARTYLAAVAAEASLAVGSMHRFAETLGAWSDTRMVYPCRMCSGWCRRDHAVYSQYRNESWAAARHHAERP